MKGCICHKVADTPFHIQEDDTVIMVVIIISFSHIQLMFIYYLCYNYYSMAQIPTKNNNASMPTIINY